MLTSEQREAALKKCETQTLWKPLHARSILALALHDEGDYGGVHVPQFKQRHKYQALVVATNDCERVKPGDLIVFDIGRGEELVTFTGEVYFFITEKNAFGIDETFWASDAKVPVEQQLPSGLWVSHAV